MLNIVTTSCYVFVSQSASLNVYFFENLMMMPLVLMMVINPVVTIYFVAPYRKGFRSWFPAGPVGKPTTIVTIVSNST
uniref:Uncharacterized protein n=1 Tax=Caenorhabditis japonica TaxID=281687 RepID=A0A8R1HU76_CAEJA